MHHVVSLRLLYLLSILIDSTLKNILFISLYSEQYSFAFVLIRFALFLILLYCQ